jgi:hypothetical protein
MSSLSLDLPSVQSDPDAAECPSIEAPAEVDPAGPSAADDAWHAGQNADWHDLDSEPDWDALAEESAMLAGYEAGCLPL